uniref:F4 family fimbrial subunit n=1 Tax=Citrobacter arsenatis TaxID=2546350 RepID=UPI00300E49E2
GAGLVCGSVQAAYTEGDLGAGNVITLQGKITNTNTPWSWQVGSDQKNWNTTKMEWLVTGAEATADFSGKGNIPVLDGYLTSMVASTVLGMHPVITMSGDGYKVTAGAGSVEQTAEVTAKGLTDANDPASEVDGKMTFKLVQGAVGVYTGADNNVYYLPVTLGGVAAQANTTNSNYRNAVNTANTNMQLADDWAAGPYTGRGVNFASSGTATASLGRKRTYSGFHSNIHSTRVTFPAATIPETWNATLSVVVAYQ